MHKVCIPRSSKHSVWHEPSCPIRAEFIPDRSTACRCSRSTSRSGGSTITTTNSQVLSIDDTGTFRHVELDSTHFERCNGGGGRTTSFTTNSSVTQYCRTLLSFNGVRGRHAAVPGPDPWPDHASLFAVARAGQEGLLSGKVSRQAISWGVSTPACGRRLCYFLTRTVSFVVVFVHTEALGPNLIRRSYCTRCNGNVGDHLPLPSHAGVNLWQVPRLRLRAYRAVFFLYLSVGFHKGLTCEAVRSLP